MTYQETLDYLFSQLPMYQRIGKAAYKADLATTVALDEYFGRPHEKYHSIHIAGTNGKGSVSHMLAAVLQEAGYRTGLYTSPHLVDFRERIRIDGIPVAREYIIDFVEQHYRIFESLSPSFFEMTVAMAFDYFAREKVDIAVIETGMGGRLDSTNIITPLVSVITNIGNDHHEFLGNTLQKIACEKAGIIKPGVPVVVGEFQNDTADVFITDAGQKKSEISFASKIYDCNYSLLTSGGMQSLSINKFGAPYISGLQTDLLGFYQQKNIITLLHTIDILNQSRFKIDLQTISVALKRVSESTGLRGRWEIIGTDPLVICDTAHNEEGIISVLEQIASTPRQDLHMVIGFVNDKNIGKIIQLLPSDAIYYFTQASIPRALDASELMGRALLAGLRGNSYETVDRALAAAKENAGKNDLIFVGGSTFVVADILVHS
jgi:dihydrofolate synthase / folylpolyglutamate synthase